LLVIGPIEMKVGNGIVVKDKKLWDGYVMGLSWSYMSWLQYKAIWLAFGGRCGFNSSRTTLHLL